MMCWLVLACFLALSCRASYFGGVLDKKSVAKPLLRGLAILAVHTIVSYLLEYTISPNPTSTTGTSLPREEGRNNAERTFSILVHHHFSKSELVHGDNDHEIFEKHRRSCLLFLAPSQKIGEI